VDRVELARLDATRVWHPYGHMRAARPPLVVESARICAALRAAAAAG
jgi:hypothetical protein